MNIKRRKYVKHWLTTAFACLFLTLSSTCGVRGDSPDPGDKKISPRIPAFPGAEGAGMWSVGGRGGKVYEVTNLNDSGPGSLRQAIEAEGKRIVVFRISGTIALKSFLVIRNPYITIASQTAPGDGICLKDFGFQVATRHVVVRYIRSRSGDNVGIPMDSMTVMGESYDVIIDHCSASWGVDETLSVVRYRSLQWDKVTIQWCMITESLNRSVSPKGEHGFGSLIRGGWGSRCTFHHNLFAHHSGRSPRPGNYVVWQFDPIGLLFDFRNNVVYNWGGRHAGYNADGTNGTDSVTQMNFVANYYKQGPNSYDGIAFQETTTTAMAFFSGNSMNGKIPDDPWSLVSFGWFSEDQKKTYKLSEQITVAPVATDDAETAYKKVLAGAGAVVPRRDAVDIRIINDVINGTGRIIDDEDEVGGWPVLNSLPAPIDSDHDGMPDEWEKARGLDPADDSDGPLDDDGDGYTNVEEYLNSLVKF